MGVKISSLVITPCQVLAFRKTRVADNKESVKSLWVVNRVGKYIYPIKLYCGIKKSLASATPHN